MNIIVTIFFPNENPIKISMIKPSIGEEIFLNSYGHWMVRSITHVPEQKDYFQIRVSKRTVEEINATL